MERKTQAIRCKMKLTVTRDGNLSPPAELLSRHGLEAGGDVLVDDVDGAIGLRTLDQIVASVQARSKALIAAASVASVDDFLAERAREGADE